jgi:hypothetical protein
VAYNKNDKATTMEYVNKIKAIEPTNSLAKQLEDLMAKPAAGTKAAAGKKPAK